MNDLEMVTSKIVSAREIIDAAIDRIQEHQYDKAETMMSAAYEFLEYYLSEFDEKFKLAWQETVKKQDIGFEVDTTLDDCMPSWGHSDMEALKYTEEELDAMCDKAEAEEKKKYENKNGVTYTDYVKAQIEANSAWNDGWTREYYQKIVDKYEGKKEEKTLTYDEAIAAGWSMCDDGFWMPPQDKWNPPQNEDKVKKWILPVEECKDTDTDETEYFVSFPDDLLEAAKLKEGDQVRWVDNGDGSYTITKVTKPLGMDEC